MGNKIMGNFRKQRFQGFNQDQIDYLDDKWDLISKGDYIDPAKFADGYNITQPEALKFLAFFDVDSTGRVDKYKFKVGAAHLCQSDPESTAKHLFEIYDFNGDSFIDESDLKIFARSLLDILNYYEERSDPTEEEVDERVKSILKKWDHQDNDGKLSLEEWVTMLRKDPDVLKMQYEYGFITKADATIGETDYDDMDSDIEAETERKYKERDERKEKIKNGIEHTETTEEDHTHGIEKEEDPMPWKDKVKDKAPSTWKQGPDSNCPPNASLELEYVYGIRCHDVRNNLRYGDKGQLVYHTGGVGVVMDSEKLTQRHFLEHSDDITCLDVYGNLVLTGQHGMAPTLIVWDLNTFKVISVWKDQLQNGVANCCFSNNGKLVAGIAMDDDHSIAIYDIAQGVKYRADPKISDFGLVAQGKITKKEVFDIKFDMNDSSIIAACMKEVNIITWKNGQVISERAVWRNEKPQAALCVVFLDTSFVTGMFTGQIMVWKDNKVDRAIKAHTDPVQAMWTRFSGRGIISATKRGIIMVWDITLSKLFEVDTRDIGLEKQLIYPPGPAISSVCESPDGKILFATRRSEIVEIQPFGRGQRPQAKLLMQGHFYGELWGLTVHPTNFTFYTVGEDQLLAQWDSKNKRIIRQVEVQSPSKTCNISPNGKFLAIGGLNGRIHIYESNNLKLVKDFHEYIDPDKETITEVKFSPNSEILAVAYCPPYSTIVFYSTKNWMKINAVTGVLARIYNIDFSLDGKYIQVSTADNDTTFYSVTLAKLVESGETVLRDEKWSTYTNIFGWSTQGIWPPCSDGSDINTVDRSKDGTLLVSCDDFGKLKLFRYPCPIENSGYYKFNGHTSTVTNVRFIYDSSYVISVGGDELSIFQWRVDNQPQQTLKIDHSAIDLAQQEESKEPDLFSMEKQDAGDQAMATKPFLGELNASTPSWYKPNNKRDNVEPHGNLSLHHAMGFRYFYMMDEARDTCAWTHDGNVSFVTAALGVVQDIKSSVQSFFNLHPEDIVSFAMHPSRKIVATGQMAQAGKAKCIDIYVWDVDTKQALAHFNEFHLRAIVLLKFSPSGNLLLSVGQDDNNSLAIHDWQANRLIATSSIDKAKVNGAAWASEDEFTTVGNKHVKFWKLNGRNVQGKMGQQAGQFDSQFCVTYAFKNQVVITGGGSGNLLVWKGGSNDKPTPAHGGKVQSLYMDNNKGILYSAGMDGKVLSWNYQNGVLTKGGEIVDMNKVALFKPGITAMDIYEKNGAFLLGTCSAQIFAYEPGNKRTTLVQQGHFGEELWGACPSPNNHLCVTAGADSTVRLWDIDKRKMIIASKAFPHDIRAVDWAMNNKFIVCGDIMGYIYLLDPNTLEVKDTGKTKFTQMKKVQSTYWIEDLKISPDSKCCAFGAHGCPSHVEIWEISYPKFGKSRSINAGLTSALLHLDWSTDSSIAVVNSQAYELKFVNTVANKNAQSSACKDVEFATWTCKLGFPVKGIFPGPDYSDVNTVCRSNSKKYLATGEDTQKVVLFQYPVVVEKQKRKEYVGHSSHVTRVRFTFDDNYLISTGGLDKTLIIWKTDFGSQAVVDHSKEHHEEGDDDIEQIQPKKKKVSKAPEPVKIMKQQDELFEQESQDAGDQFMAVKPWMGAIKEPSQPYYNNKKEGSKEPQCTIALEYVYGYRTKDMRNNLYYLKDGKVLYNAAALGIVLDVETNTQTFFTEHIDDITAIDLSPDRQFCATGELGPKPLICVWDVDTKVSKCTFKGVLTKGICCLNFSPSGNRLVAGAIDVDHNIAVLDVSGSGSVIWKDKSGPNVIIDVRFTNENSFTTIGVKLYQIWQQKGTVFASASQGKFGKNCNQLSAITTSGNNVICGAKDGSVQVWQNDQIATAFTDKHTTSCDALLSTADYVITGGRDGIINFLDSKQLNKQILKLDFKAKFGQYSQCPGIRAINLHPTDNLILVGTLGSEIFELKYNTPKINDQTQFTMRQVNTEPAQPIMSGHYCPNLKWTNEVWGLDVLRDNSNRIATCSDDGTVRIWDYMNRRQVSVGSCTQTLDGKPEPLDHGTGDLTDKCKARAIAVHPEGSMFVVGMKDGTMRVFDSQLKQTKVYRMAKEWVSDIKFSPDGTVFVHGSHDNAIYAQKVKDFKPLGKAPMKKHSSYITHIDFSCDGVNLHSTCGAYELLFWDVAQGKQLPGGASGLRDEKWYTWTVTLGWPVQGIWPECADGTDINAVDRSNVTIDGKSDFKSSYFLLASGDDFGKVRILRYPSLVKSSKAVYGKGHSSHVTNVRWSPDDQRIFSTGGEDQCVMQWLVSKK